MGSNDLEPYVGTVGEIVETMLSGAALDSSVVRFECPSPDAVAR
jgi:hypothetical protein